MRSALRKANPRNPEHRVSAVLASERPVWARVRRLRSETSAEKPITAHAFARLVGSLAIYPVQLERVRGYRRDSFQDARARF